MLNYFSNLKGAIYLDYGGNYKKERILKKAVKNISEKGFKKTTINEIAEEADVAKGTIYNYFGNKKGLHYSLIEKGIQFLTSEIEINIESTTDPIEKIKIITEIYLNFYKENFNYGKLLYREIWGNTKNFEKKSKNIKKNHTLLIKEVIIEGQKSGEIGKDLDADALAVSLLGIINSTVIYWKIINDSFPKNKIKNNVLKTYLTGILKETKLVVDK